MQSWVSLVSLLLLSFEHFFNLFHNYNLYLISFSDYNVSYYNYKSALLNKYLNKVNGFMKGLGLFAILSLYIYFPFQNGQVGTPSCTSNLTGLGLNQRCNLSRDHIYMSHTITHPTLQIYQCFKSFYLFIFHKFTLSI